MNFNQGSTNLLNLETGRSRFRIQKFIFNSKSGIQRPNQSVRVPPFMTRGFKPSAHGPGRRSGRTMNRSRLFYGPRISDFWQVLGSLLQLIYFSFHFCVSLNFLIWTNIGVKITHPKMSHFGAHPTIEVRQPIRTQHQKIIKTKIFKIQKENNEWPKWRNR